MSTMKEAARVIEALKTEWETISNFCLELTDEEWDMNTDCSAWSVKDNLSHMIGTELFLTGQKLPDIDLGDTSHLKNDIAKMNELWVEERRPRHGAEVLQEFNEVTADRIKTLSNLSEAEWEAEGMTPVGMSPYLRFMKIRTLDCWMHEQDMRYATSKPGNQEGLAMEICLDEVASAMGFVVGKKSAAPDGTKVVFDLSGKTARKIKIEVKGGRANMVDDFGEPNISIQMKAITFTRLTGGRIAPSELIAKKPDAFKVESDSKYEKTAEAIIENLDYMF